MKRIDFWFDFISPFAYLAFERLPQALEGCSVVVQYQPVLFASLLQHWGQKGPAEIEPKRAFTFRHVHWQAAQWGIPLQTPAEHPFNPLAHLRLAAACGPNRRVVEVLFRHIWQGAGADANDPLRLQQLTDQLHPELNPVGAEVKAGLRRQSELALARGVFGVPTFECEGRLFWGVDALPMLRAFVQGEPWFDGPDWAREGQPRAGVVRR